MKKLLTFGFVVLLIQQINCQIYIDVKQLKDAGIDINQSPQQDLHNLGIGNCDLELTKSVISKGDRMHKNTDGERGSCGDTPLTLAKSSLNIIQSGESSYWRD